MTIYTENHPYHYEMENLVRLFFPNEKITVTGESNEINDTRYIITALKENGEKLNISAELHLDDYISSNSVDITPSENDREKEAEREMAVVLYKLLSEYTGKIQPWGILTGVRPIKLFRSLCEKNGKEYAEEYFMEKLLVSKEKTLLSSVTEQYERKILSYSRNDSFSLYISIPFCPSRCSYCSFVSQTIEKAQKLVQPYFELLCREIEYTGRIVKELGLHLESVYIGGGTPTTLSALQLSELIEKLRSCFDISECREFTVEAGRPDTIDEEKLLAIRNGGVDRISINPQTLNDSVLEVIGRKHNSSQILQAYSLARDIGFTHINMDLIAGLPTDTVDSFRSTIDRICELYPESITVHTLALKRSSRMTLQGKNVDADNENCSAAAMLRYGEKKLTECGYHPYYLYRQSRMEGNLENVGWSRDGFDGIYNVFVMDETHTIIGCGAGAVTKLKVPGSTSLSRIFNYKYPYEYINGFDEMLKRKDQVKQFYDELS